MAKVLCTLPNVGAEMQLPSGAVAVFTPLPERNGVVSDEISDEDAAALCTITGYQPHETSKVAGAGQPTGQQNQQTQAEIDAAAAEADELARLRARGVELNIPHAEQMGAKRLVNEIARAEKLAAEKPAGAAGEGEQKA